MKIENKNITQTRALACLLVILIHVSAHFGDYPEIYFGLFLRAHSFFATPIFYMITGVFLFRGTKPLSANLFFKRFLKIALPLFYFGTIFYLWDTSRGIGNYPYWQAFTVPRYPSWYLMSILPVYMLSPLIIFPKIDSLKSTISTLLFVGFCFFLTEAGKTTPFNIWPLYNFNQPLIYMMTGYLLWNLATHEEIRCRKPLLLILFFIVSEIFYGFLLIIMSFEGTFSNGSISIYIQASLLFLWIQSRSPRDSFIDLPLSIIARHSLSIFGWHIIILQTVAPFIRKLGLPILFYFIALYMVTLFLALGLALIETYLRRIISSYLGQKLSFAQKP